MQISYSPKPHNRVDYYPLQNGYADVFLYRNKVEQTDEDSNPIYVAEEVYFQIHQSISKEDIESNFNYMWEDAEQPKTMRTFGLMSTSDESLWDYISVYLSKAKSTVSAMRLKSVSEDESEVSMVYVTAKDSEDKIAELRSLPNGTKDEVRVIENKLIKRIGDKTNVASGTVINYSDMADNGTYYAWNDDGETETGVKGDTLGIDATELTYQLAEPIVTPIQVSGTLLSNPNGTVYVEPVVADAGIYDDGITILHHDLPIDYIEKLSKVNFTTGLETEIDVSKVILSGDKKSFTHPDLVDGDIIFFTYFHNVEGTEGELSVEYYDSRYILKDSVTGKFYKVVPTVANGVLTNGLVEV